MLKYPYLCNSFLVDRDEKARHYIERLIADNTRLRGDLAAARRLLTEADRETAAGLGSD